MIVIFGYRWVDMDLNQNRRSERLSILVTISWTFHSPILRGVFIEWKNAPSLSCKVKTTTPLPSPTLLKLWILFALGSELREEARWQLYWAAALLCRMGAPPPSSKANVDSRWGVYISEWRIHMIFFFIIMPVLLIVCKRNWSSAQKKERFEMCMWQSCIILMWTF